MLFLIVIILVLFLSVNLILSKWDWFAPGVIFSGVFLLSAIMCLLMADTYQITFHYQTLVVLLMGCGVFTVTEAFVGSTRIAGRKRQPAMVRHEAQMIEIPRFITVVMLLVVAVYGFMAIQYIRRAAASIGASGALTTLIATFNRASKFSDSANFSQYRPLLFVVLDSPCRCYAYITLYAFIYNLVNFKKLDRLQLIYLLSFVAAVFLQGDRSPVFRLVTAGIMYTVFFICAKRRKRFSTKKLYKLAIILFAVFYLLMISRYLVGRYSENSTVLSPTFAYFGGPLLNLDTFLQGTVRRSEIWGQQTFRNLINMFGGFFHISQWSYKLDLPFMRHNGIVTGNVYTTFYMFLYDFGYLGVIPLTAVIAIYYCIAYKRVSNFNRMDYGSMPLGVLIYGFLFNDLIMLMFSNRFYETVGKIGFVENIVYFILFQKIITLGFHDRKPYLRLRLNR